MELLGMGNSSSEASSITLLGTVVYISRHEHHLRQGDEPAKSGFQEVTGIYQDITRAIQDAVDQHKLHRTFSEEKEFSDYIKDHCDTGERIPLANQESIINLISNDATPQGRSNVSHFMYFSTGTADQPDENGNIISKYIPTSMRNSVLYLWRLNRPSAVLDVLWPKLFVKEKRKETQSPAQEASRTKRNRPDDTLPSQVELNIPSVENVATSSSSYSTTPFMKFQHQLVGSTGVLKWRIHGDKVDVISMNDIDLSSGNMMKNHFVHMCRWTSSLDGNTDATYFCTCRMYTAAVTMDDGLNPTKCCHIRFFNEQVEPYYSSLFCTTSAVSSIPLQTPLGQKIHQSLQSVNIPVIRLDLDAQYHRFSVLAKDVKSCTIVKLQGNRFSCTNGKCRAGKGHKRKVATLGDSSNCEHLEALHANLEQWQTLCPVEGENSEEDSDTEQAIDAEDLGPEPTTDPQNDTQHFNPETGLWDFPSVSQHVPRQRDDPGLRTAIQNRLAICIQNQVSDDGYFMKKTDNGMEAFSLYPILDKNQMCTCGELYWNEDHTDGILEKRYRKPTKVYLQNGVALYWICDRVCLNRSAECTVPYCGHQDGLHILTTESAAGDEIGWDFISCVTTSQMSLSAYCSITGGRYYSSKVKFMSRQLFTDWIFSWLANFKIDFRQPCNTCNFNPKILACDGTKIGMFFKNVSMKSIETATTQEEVTPTHRITSRQFFAYTDTDTREVKAEKRQAREDLRYFVAKYSNSLKDLRISERTEEERKMHLMNHVYGDCSLVMSKFIQFQYSQELMASLCEVFRVFATGSPLTSVINYRFLDSLSAVLAGELGVETLKTQLPEICSLLDVAKIHGNLAEISSFLLCIVMIIRSTHSSDKQPGDGSEIKEEYNPEKLGRAYYFTPHGGRLRDLPKYNVTKVAKDKSDCRKVFVDAAKSGVTYLFLWFDPLHGHCYGFHVIVDSEGRKDPFCSALLYMESPPAEVFYDFSCQLEEYALNREPVFWRNTRFFHDIFHGYSHKCEYVYNSQRVPSLDIGINSEICEQFNSYIQKIKYSARSMNQNHFIFYLQYFIHHWNELKRAKNEEENRMLNTLKQ